ncbi:hypothetical protein GCM10009633_24010 [Janibacter melonis]|uniref:nucleotidyl transferase AbiEii/AbiGii toxin family protein n=1 Tax=Janibacter melonis TaxID=262209 RepID=UPI001E46778E|nr:nucleotidyl transferase AbiEii/AbiGii toxin family protein [Janibacter melonis]MCB5993229.1 nucleotidyl transferase AbiEii/AbiGii toxin family protein [Janibacter melonis]
MSRREDQGYRTPAAFRRALDDRLKNRAKLDQVPFAELRRRYLLQCYLARVFSLPGENWVLKGGSGLAVRLPGARHTKDIDLCHLHDAAEADACIAQLRTAGEPSPRDPFVFTVVSQAPMTGRTGGYRLGVSCALGAQQYESFTIDLALDLEFVGTIETIERALPVEISDVQPPPPMRLYPLVDQVSDKVAAMYEQHAGNPSTRYRDLVDLVLIAQSGAALDSATLVAALRLQEHRRGFMLPAQLVSPAPAWTAGYRAEAGRARTAIATDLDAGLAIAGELVNPALAMLR